MVDELNGPEIAAFLAEHLHEMRTVTPAESSHALDLDGLRAPGVTVWSISDGPAVLACGALKELDPEHAEIKSMRTAGTHRGQGLGERILRHMIDEAQRSGYRRLSLETGSDPFFAPARRLYQRHGFTYCEPFGDYQPDPLSVFMTIALEPPAAPDLEVLFKATPEVGTALLVEIRALLDDAFAGDPDGGFGDDDWHHTLGGLHAIGIEGGRVVAHAAVITRTITVGEVAYQAGYVEGVATLPARQRQGLGTLVMRPMNDHIRRHHDLGVLGTGAYEFYERLGWERWSGPSFVHRVDGTVARTEEDDDGLMVLRFGPTAELDLHAAIMCEDRPGDCW